MRWLVLLALGGCRFEIGASVTDAFVEPDAAIDAPPDAPGPPIQLVQHSAYYLDAVSTVDCAYPAAQVAGDTNIVVVSWFSNTGEVTRVTDTAGNTYVPAGLDVTGAYSLRVFYALDIQPAGAGTNRVTAVFPAAMSYPKVRVLEYSGLAYTNPYEIGVGAFGSGPTAVTAAVTTTTPHTLLLAANVINGSSTAIAPFVAQDTSDGDLIEAYELLDRGTYAASGTVSSSGSWVMVLGAFRGR